MILTIPLVAMLGLSAPTPLVHLEAPLAAMASGSTAVQAPGQGPSSSPGWEPTYRSGRALFISGIVLTAAGALVAAGSGFFILLTFVMGNADAVLPGAGWAALAGGCLMLVGIPLLVVGIVKKRRASRMKAGLSLDATVHEATAVPTLTWRF